LKKYSKGRERRTEITSFDAIRATQVVANNAKLYMNAKEGFIGSGLKKDDFVCDCSDIDDVIVFLKDGKFKVVRIADKVFVGKNIIHVAVWKKGDERTTYNLIYVDGKTGRSMAKRFNVKAITRDRDYDLTKGTDGSKLLYFTANPNGEAEILSIQLTQGCKAKKKLFDFNFGELTIKGRGSGGNIVTRYPVRKITQKEVGQSTLGAIKIWMDDVSGRLNMADRGTYLGAFDTGDQILVVYADGSYEITDFELTNRFEAKDVVWIGKFDPESVISALYYDGIKKWSVVKRFKIETNKAKQRYSFITEHRMSKLIFASTKPNPKINYSMKIDNKKMTGVLDLAEFIDVKGWKSLGNKLADHKVTGVKEIEDEKPSPKEVSNEKLQTGDTVDFDLDDKGQTKLF
jgi:topoisomerase-4 subunit A